MKFSLGWLKDHLDTEADVELIASTLTRIGLEVESVYNPHEVFKGIVVGYIESADKHPQADKLQVCKVNYGGGEVAQIICGAPNARAGIYVALALPGAIIPNGSMNIKTAKIRGIESRGMMCSYRELMLGQEGVGIIEISERLCKDSILGRPIADVLDLDTIIEVAITPNRADCFGVRGIARDLFAAGIGKLKPAKGSVEVKGVDGFNFPLNVSFDGDQPKIDRYVPKMALQVIRGVKNVQSPDWLKRKLKSAGLEPISALVDITNYFCLDRARPLHAYDVGCIRGNELSVRFAKSGEEFLDIKGRSARLSDKVAVISDSDGPLGVLGVMGGDRSKINGGTSTVMLESALFGRSDIAYAGRELNIISEARTRFERGVDSDYVLEGLKDAAAMIIDICGGEPSSIYLREAKCFEPTSVYLRPSRLERVSGMKISTEVVKEKLTGLGLGVLSENADKMVFSVPSWRHDISIEEDLIEEVLRLVGYDNIPTTYLPQKLSADLDGTISRERKILSVKKAFCACSFDEAITYAFLSKESNCLFCEDKSIVVELANPISVDLSIMRCSMLPNLIQACTRNKNSGIDNVALFEVGSIYRSLDDQVLMAGGCILDSSPVFHWSGNISRDVFTIKSYVMSVIESLGVAWESLHTSSGAPSWYHPGRSGKVIIGKKEIANFGEIHPVTLKGLGITGCNVLGFEVNLDILFSLQNQTSKAVASRHFQSVVRDFAFIFDRGILAGDIIATIKTLYPQIIKDINIFDIYEGDKIASGKRSLAIRIKMDPLESTFTDDQLQEISSTVINKMSSKFGGIIRQ